MAEEPLIGIVTVLYNSQTVLKDFFNSLDKQHYRNIVLYVVDNKSPDDSLLQAKLLSTNCSFKSIFIENYCNEGIAKGNNLGIEKAISDGCEFILLSNNDVVIYEDTITNLYNRLTKKKVSISVPKIYMYDNKHIWFAGGSFSKLTFLAHHIGFNSKDLGQYDQEKYITYSPTCFMLIHRSVFKSVGMMDGKFFVYWDDTDFVFRALKQKYKILYVPTSKLEHKESVSTGKKSDFFYRYIFKNREYFIAKHSKIAWLRHLADLIYWRIIMRRKMCSRIGQWNIIGEAMQEGWRMRLDNV